MRLFTMTCGAACFVSLSVLGASACTITATDGGTGGDFTTSNTVATTSTGQGGATSTTTSTGGAGGEASTVGVGGSGGGVGGGGGAGVGGGGGAGGGVSSPYSWIAVRSRCTNAADLNINTPGPDIDAVELMLPGGSVYLADVYPIQGTAIAGNANADPSTTLGAPDGVDGSGACFLDDDTGDARFWSMGSGDANDTEGVLLAQFDGNVAIPNGTTIRVHEIAASGCTNVSTVRQDTYEVYIGLDAINPNNLTVDDLTGNSFMSLGQSMANGGVNDFDASW